MNKIYSLCENDRGKFFYEILRKFYEEASFTECDDLEFFEEEVYEIRCGNIILGYSQEEERIFCKETMNFAEVEKKKVKFIKSKKKNNKVIPKHYEFFLNGVFPYYGIKKRFENCIVLIDNPLKIGEVNELCENCLIVVFGRCLNHKFLDYRTKMAFFYLSPFEDIEIDGYLVKKFERFKSNLENFEIACEGEERVSILESIVYKKIEDAKEKIRKFRFLDASRIIFEEIPEVFKEFNFKGYSFEEFKDSLEYYKSFLGELFGCFEKKEIRLKIDDNALRAYRLIERTIEDIIFLKNKVRNKKIAYVKPPEEFFSYFSSMEKYISEKTGIEVKIVEKLPKEKKYKDVGILLE